MVGGGVMEGVAKEDAESASELPGKLGASIYCQIVGYAKMLDPALQEGVNTEVRDDGV